MLSPTKEEEEEMVDAAAERGVSSAASLLLILRLAVVEEERWSTRRSGADAEARRPGDQLLGGSKWDALDFFLASCTAFHILFMQVACGIMVATYNKGAIDFKQTPVYKRSIQSRELLEEPEASNYDVFKANPTDDAPNLE